MTYTKQTWVDEVPASTPVKYKITDDTNGELGASAKIEVVTNITTPGTAVNATKLNHMEDGIEAAHAAAAAAAAAAATAQEGADKANYLYDLRDVPVYVRLNGDSDLVVTKKAGFPIPPNLEGATLIAVSGRCKTGSSSGNVVLTAYNGAVNLLSTNITIEVGETSSKTAVTQPAIGASNVVHEDDYIEAGVLAGGAGVGVKYAGVLFIFRPAAMA